MNKILTLEAQLIEAEEEERKTIQNSPQAKAQRRVQKIKREIKDDEKKKIKKQIQALVNECLDLGQKLESVKKEAENWRKKGPGFNRRYAELHTHLSVKTDKQIKLRNQLKELEIGGDIE